VDDAASAPGAPAPPDAPSSGPASSREHAPAAPAPPARELARRVRASRVLSGTQKKYWLSVLPHLLPADRARLDAILRGDVAATGGEAAE
jgi:hypothetical protein